MLARITNYSYRQVFPTCIGNIRLPRQRPVTDEFDLQALKELSEFEHVHVEVLGGKELAPQVDYAGFRINELRSMAARAGVKRAFRMTKAELIKTLEERNVTTV